MNLPFGRNHPTYIKFVVSKSFAITSNVLIFRATPRGPRQPLRIAFFPARFFLSPDGSLS
jgi:hypothetical protein